MLLIARPGNGLDATGVTFALCAVGAGVTYQLLSRVLVTTERTVALLFLSLGVCGGLDHFLYTAAYRHASARYSPL